MANIFEGLKKIITKKGVSSSSNRRERRIHQKQTGIKITGTNKPYIRGEK